MSAVEEQATVGDSRIETGDYKAEAEQAKKPLELPPEIRELRKLQLETKDIHREFFKRIYELELEFHKKHELVYNKRRDIINGKGASTTTADATESTEERREVTPGGIPRFWSNVLNATLFEIRKSDRPILDHLTDVRAISKPFSDLGFVLEFDFSPNEYFENETLTKEYFYNTSSLESEMVHQGPKIYKSVGCEIKWKDGKTMPSDSFFNFFRCKTEIEEIPESEKTHDDFEMGYFIKERIIPRAVLFYNENFHLDAPLPSVDSCYSYEQMSPTTSSMLPNTGSCCDKNKSTATSSTACDVCGSE